MIKEILEFAGSYRASSIKKLTGREGYGWEAKILKDGVEIGTAVDWADGGPVRLHFNNRIEEDLLLAYASGKSKDNFEVVEMFLDDLVNYELLLKKIKSDAKKYVLVDVLPEQSNKDENCIETVYSMFKCIDNPTNRAALKEKFKVTEFMNDDIGLIDIPKVKKSKLKQ